jgi:hypothetical protein
MKITNSPDPIMIITNSRPELPRPKSYSEPNYPLNPPPIASPEIISELPTNPQIIFKT